ncbi:short-chain dehydrogenase [Sphingomonas sp. Leaf17]|uniref:SDR family oxidoreductase n=1 Tax=Sphingomonas sp. Leaf17 TaxID=1735683 RepID=UPI0006FEFA16|nr:SDR family oxidoreductase [Sphingomonas sp. Leaf17]KQM63642.1 short-chain dehydrogenase [Sphingomonas sp. Leaf17]
MKGRTVLITGGARRLGATIARTLAAGGYRVVIHYNTSGDDADQLAADLGGVAVEADLNDGVAAAGLIYRARRAIGGPVEALVNSASAFDFDRPPVIRPDHLARMLAINLSAPVLLASALAAQDDVAEGAVVNLIDQKVVNLNPDFFSYSCAKVALAGATTMLAQALGPRVRVNAVSPGITLPSGDQTEAEFAQASCRNLLQRPVGADRVADAVAYLLGARGVTGQNLFVDCGQRFLPRDGDVMFEGRAGG